MFNIAVIYDNGIGVEQNKEKAIHWYKLASDNNHKVAQYNLAWMFYNGDKVEIKMNIHNGNFKFIIYDNGTKGKGSKKTGHGLRNMEMRAKRIGADIEVATKNGFNVIVSGKLTLTIK